MLPPHPWDDDAHRTAILTAFDVWSICYEQGNRMQAHRWHMELTRLTRDAERRRQQLQQPLRAARGVPVDRL
jgi:hypothetical protein